MNCFFVSDLHGRLRHFDKLFELILLEKPSAVFMGGDLLPSGFGLSESGGYDQVSFVTDFLLSSLRKLKEKLGRGYPEFYVIMGNDDLRAVEIEFIRLDDAGLWHYLHDVRHEFSGIPVYGYACVPPTPFTLKDWERYDVSRYVDPGCLAPEEGRFSVDTSLRELQLSTIQRDLTALFKDDELSRAVVLFHAPPYNTHLDRAGLDGKMVDYVALDVHVGSIAIRRFIENRQPALTLHGHIHESARLTGKWWDTLGTTRVVSAAHDGQELSLIRFEADKPAASRRSLIPVG